MDLFRDILDGLQTPILFGIFYRLGVFQSRWTDHETRIQTLETTMTKKLLPLLLFAGTLSFAAAPDAAAMGWLSPEAQQAVETAITETTETAGQTLDQIAPAAGAAATAATGNPLVGTAVSTLFSVIAGTLAGWAESRRRKAVRAVEVVVKHAEPRLTSADKAALKAEAINSGVEPILKKGVDRVTIHKPKAA